ncbi:MAG: hypothetical protein HUJ66_08540 [Oscillospiraceae bacterium]|nr:hypothetical protein [Oscillospiraceae bacterium]
MRKNALIMCCFVCALGAFGAFFRWLQNQITYDPVTGMTEPGLLNVMVPLVIVAAAVVFYLLPGRLLSGLSYPESMRETFRGTTVLHSAAAWIIGGVVAAGGIVTFFGTATDAQAGLFRFIAVLSVLCGISFPAICNSAKRNFAPGLVSVFCTLPVVIFVVWLVGCYMRNSSVPNLWSYGVEIITISCVIYAFYCDAGFAFGKPAPKSALFISMLAAFMCLTSLADSRFIGLQMILFGTGAMLLMYCWMIVSNMRTAQERAAEKETPKPGSKPAEKPAEAPAEEPVIPAGKPLVTDEPTLQAPSRSDSEVDRIINELKNE